MRTPDPPLMLKVRPKTVTKLPEMAKKSMRVHVGTANSLCTIQLPTTLSLGHLPGAAAIHCCDIQSNVEGAGSFTSRPSQSRLSVYRGSKAGSIDGWMLVMCHYLQLTQTKATPDDKVWSVIGHLENEARNYIINKVESIRDPPERRYSNR